MAKSRVLISIDEELVAELDLLVEKRVFANRSQAVQVALREKMARLRHHRLARESAKLHASTEEALTEEGMWEELAKWPEY